MFDYSCPIYMPIIDVLEASTQPNLPLNSSLLAHQKKIDAQNFYKVVFSTQNFRIGSSWKCNMETTFQTFEIKF